MRTTRALSLLIMLAVYLPLVAQNPIEKFINQPIFRHANISILVRDLETGKDIWEHRPFSATIPASTMKVITTATALELLGADYRYETQLSYDGNLGADGVLNGNLYITGSGDPTLGSSKMGDKDFLSKWVAAIKKAGIRQITGNIIGDESRFDNEGSNSKWTWDDIGNYYAPGINALTYLDNTVSVSFRSGAPGSQPEIIEISPEIPGMQIENNLQSSNISFDSAYFYGAPKSMHRSVRGEIPANKPVFVVRAEIPDPALLLAQDFYKKLRSEGVEVKGTPACQSANMQNTPATLRTTIYTHYSTTLNEIVNEANQKSNNFYTEQIFKSLSLTRQAVASNKNAKDVIRNFWRSKGLNVNQLFQEDGSGLSPTNAVSAAFFTDLMQYMYKQSRNKEVFFNSLSVAGQAGTLSGVLRNTKLSGKVYAKSGTIARVRAYTGYVVQGNKTYAFAILVNNSSSNSWQTLSRIEELLLDMF